MTRTIDAGIFLPTGNHGWITSVNSPAVETAEYTRVREIVQGAEALGFDFALSASIWRGRKGPSKHWMHVLESLTSSAALLEATTRIKVFSTINMTFNHPATIAKMVATLDQIGPGRVGLNVVTGDSRLDLAHLGLWNDELDHDRRYDLADEWIQLAKKCWTEEVIDHDGEFFHTEHGHMGPKPSRMPDLVNAGASARGFRFAAENCDLAFFPASDDPKSIETAKRGKDIAREHGNPNLRSYGCVTLIPGDTDEEAHARLDHYNAGVDLEALEDVAAGYQQNKSYKELSESSKALTGGEKRSAVLPGELVGSYETLARRLATTVLESDLDGIMLVVPDYVEDLAAVAQKTLPLMAGYGVECRVGTDAPASV
ncbi:LLM class flavin-dependent oxidoreductase [Paenarthrobacter sp. NPDC058040]|uniref:LLM class flavin-dependent oxidoreductase n=1 Tax=unclassified Paenarthrobacter TaxID=2634190 RepID=UPI0036DD51A9